MSTSAFLLLALASTNAAPDNILYDFSATWCGPCQQMHPIVARLEREGLPIKQVDVDANRALAQYYGVSSIPAFVLVINGKVAERSVGATSEGQLRQMLAKIPAAQPAPKTAPRKDASADIILASSKDKPQRSVKVKNTVLVDSKSTPAGPSAKSLFQLPSLPPLFRQKRDVAIDQPSEPFNDDAVVRGNNLGEPQKSVPETTAETATGTEAESTALLSSTRIRVKDEDGINFGSGTVIDSRPGRTVILTCGHIFRDLKKDSTIEVDIFDAGRSEPYVGTLIDFDSEADVGLIAIPTSNEIPKAEVATRDEAARKGQHVTSIGCGGGDTPSEQKLNVTALNRYLGPDNIECTGVPIQGRSGGGLFNEEGRVIGVCIAADPKEQRGLYSGLQCIHDLLKKTGFAHLVDGNAALAEVKPAAQSNGGDEIELQAAGDVQPKQSEEVAAADEESAPTELEEKLAAMSSHHVRTPEKETRESAEPAEAATEQTEVGLPDELGEAEIVCIIRPIGKTNSASRVVVINRASPKFVSYLTGEIDAQPQPTMKTVPRNPKLPQDLESSTERGGADRSRLLQANGRIEPRVAKRLDVPKSIRFTRDPKVEQSIDDQTAEMVAVSVQETSVIPRRYRRSAESR
jgi:thiol-disulfide isomerase/thioredoxin